MIKVTLAGTGGTIPQKNRWLSSCMLTVNGRSVLIDCGEGTQIALKIGGCKCRPIETICITHFHADHISGLPGLLLTMSNDGRTEPVTIFGPRGLSHIVRCLCVIAPALTFDVRCVEYSDQNRNFSAAGMEVTPFPVRHGVPCLGYSFVLKRGGLFLPEKAKENNVPMKLWSRLQKGEQVEFEGKLYTPDMVLGEERKGLKVTYTTDTRPAESITKNAQDSDLFICEGMFGDPEKLPRAKESCHMMFSEAAAIASKANVKKMWLTHYSPSLEYPEEFLSYASDIFPYTECGTDGKTEELVW